MIAAMFNRTDIIDQLLERGANPDAQDVNGATPLAAARLTGAKDAIARLEKING